MNRDRGPTGDPESVPVDLEAQQQELEAGGWERVVVQDKTMWRHPTSGALYPQGPAILRLLIDKQGDKEK